LTYLATSGQTLEITILNRHLTYLAEFRTPNRHLRLGCWTYSTWPI